MSGVSFPTVPAPFVADFPLNYLVTFEGHPRTRHSWVGPERSLRPTDYRSPLTHHHTVLINTVHGALKTAS